MKKFKTIALIVLTAFTTFSLTTSCSGDDGKDGINGTNGTNGETGTANVMYSNWINQNWNIENGTHYKMMDIEEPKITTQIINNGFVLGFWKFTNQNVVYTLPHTLNNSSINIVKESFYFDGKIRFIARRFDPSLVMSDLWINGDATSGIPQVRYIIVPGGVSVVGRGVTKLDYSKMSYQEVCKKFNIPE